MRIEPLGTHQTPIIAPVVSHYEESEDTMVKTNRVVGWSSFDTIGFAPEPVAPKMVPGVVSKEDMMLVEEQRQLAPTCPFLGLNGHSGYAMAV